jgi:hypothetical protein
MTLILYFFIFSSWGLGLLAALAALSMKMQEHGIRMKSLSLEIESDSLDFAGKKDLFDRIVSRVQHPAMSGGNGIPDELRKLMETGQNHPEVGEIEDGDDVVGVVFKAHSYPPGLDDNDDDDDEKNPPIGNRAD